MIPNGTATLERPLEHSTATQGSLETKITKKRFNSIYEAVAHQSLALLYGGKNVINVEERSTNVSAYKASFDESGRLPQILTLDVSGMKLNIPGILKDENGNYIRYQKGEVFRVYIP